MGTFVSRFGHIAVLIAYGTFSPDIQLRAAEKLVEVSTGVSGDLYCVLEPYCSDESSGVAYAALILDSAFGDAVVHRNRLSNLLKEKAGFVRRYGESSFDAALRDAVASRDESAVKYHSARTHLLNELSRIDEADPAGRAMAQDVMVLAWRMSSVERHALLVSAIEAHPAVETTVVESLYRCAVEEFALASAGRQQELLRQLLPERTMALPTREEVQHRLHSLASAVWTPDPVLRALDAAELAEAWLAATNQPGRLNRTERCYRLLDLSYGCITPELMPGTAPNYRTNGTLSWLPPMRCFQACRRLPTI